MESAISKAVLAVLSELERELVTDRDEAGDEALAHVSNNDASRLLLGVSIGFDRALNILHGKAATLRPDTRPFTDSSTE